MATSSPALSGIALARKTSSATLPELPLTAETCGDSVIPPVVRPMRSDQCDEVLITGTCIEQRAAQHTDHRQFFDG